MKMASAPPEIREKETRIGAALWQNIPAHRRPPPLGGPGRSGRRTAPLVAGPRAACCRRAALGDPATDGNAAWLARRTPAQDGALPCRLWRRRPACWGWPPPTTSKVRREKRTIVVSAFEFDAEFGSGFHPSRAHVSHWTRDGGGFERRANPFASFVTVSAQIIGEPNPGSLKGIP